MRLAGGDCGAPEPRQQAATQTPSQVSVQRPTAPLSVEGPPGLYMRALLAPKTEPVGWPVRWTVYKEGEPGRILYDARSINPMLPLGAGRYVVEARDGQAIGLADGRRRRCGADAGRACRSMPARCWSRRSRSGPARRSATR